MKKLLFLSAALFLLLCTACTPDDAPVASDTAFMLDTLVTVTLYGKDNPQALQGALQLCENYDRLLNRKDPGSEIYRLNHAGGAPVVVSPETREMLELALHYSELTDGAYDVTITPIADLWNFKTEQPVVPDADDLQQALARVDYHNIVLEDDTVLLKNGAQIDLGSIAKGYIGDKMGEYLRGQGVTSAIIDLGGNVLTIGEKPSGALFTIGIQKPFSLRGETLGTVQVANMAVVSSGVYERYFKLGDKLYHHILNPATGYPFDNGLQSVTILTQTSTQGDALSTPVFVLGLEKGMQLVEALPGVEAVFVTDDARVYRSSGIGSAIAYAETPAA